MTERTCRTVAAGIVRAMRDKQIPPREISVASCDGGARVLVTLEDGLMLDATVPLGFFNYDRVADAFAQAMGNATLET